MHLADLPTPAAIVDLDRAERNAAKMRARARTLGVRLRPHVKTHKCLEGARLQLGTDTGPITVSTLAEARAFADAGFLDITWAVPIPIPRLAAALELGRRVRLGLLVDHPEALRAVVEAAAAAGTRPPVYLKVDCGYHRAGVDPQSEGAAELARALASSTHVRFAGLLTHAGHSYACRGREAVGVVARQERDVVTGFAARLRAAGIEVPDVSVGSTPTLSVVEDLSGVTEVRPGNYLFYDAFQAAIGTCALSDCAFTVLATVIGAHADRLVLDAGALALSKDAGAGDAGPSPGYGVVSDLAGEPLPGLSLVSVSQEHGIVRGPPEALHRLRIGDRVRIVANHSCLAAACHDRFHGVRGQDVVALWRPCRGWD